MQVKKQNILENDIIRINDYQGTPEQIEGHRQAVEDQEKRCKELLLIWKNDKEIKELEKKKPKKK